MAWELTGNAGTTAENFLGTQDNRPLMIKTSDIEVIHISPGSLGPRTNGPAPIPGDVGIPGKVGIGTTSPAAKLEVEGPTDPLVLIDHMGATGNPALWFQQDGATTAFVWWDHVNKRLNLGTPAHNPIAAFQDDGTVDVPLTLNVSGDITMPASDFAEEFQVKASDAIEPGTVMVLEENGVLGPSEKGYDRKVAGVISGAGDYRPGLILDRDKASPGRLPLALVGKAYCKVDATYGPIEVGDLLTTSPTAGHAMKADDPIMAFGAVIGKALRSLEAGLGLIPILIALQ